MFLQPNPSRHCGFISIVGRPNVGKSSLLNALLGRKVSITCFKPQTTRYQILGIKTKDNMQTVYVDTPGMHTEVKKAFNRYLNKVASQSLIDVDAVIFVVEVLKWTHEDELVCQRLATLSCPIIVAVNKIDLLEDKQRLLPFLHKIREKLPQADFVPVSAKKQIQLLALENVVTGKLPVSEFYFPHDQCVNHSARFHVAEIIREKLMFFLQNELPYSLCVEIEKYEEQPKLLLIHALIWVEREGQKHIVIGKNGSMLHQIGVKARLELERFFDKKVGLKLWVKVKENWSFDARALQSLGMESL